MRYAAAVHQGALGTVLALSLVLDSGGCYTDNQFVIPSWSVDKDGERRSKLRR